jgi:hypothetical protein
MINNVEAFIESYPDYEDLLGQLTRDCLKAGIHLKHIKNNIIEVKPLEEELDIIKEVINNHKLKLEKIKKRKGK